MLNLPAYLTGFSSKSDGSASLRFNTQELTPNDFANLKNSLNNFEFLLFKENEVKIEDIPKEDAEEGEKKPSKRLRNVLYILWVQEGKKGEFESFYRDRMEKLIEMIKGKLE